MSSVQLEAVLARAYRDANYRKRLLTDPITLGKAGGLTPHEIASLSEIDPISLELASGSFCGKAGRKRRPRTSDFSLPGIIRRLQSVFRQIALFRLFR